MDPLLLILLGILVGLVAVVLWWYYPYVRKPWLPRLGRRRPPKSPGDRDTLGSIDNPSLVVYKGRREMELYDGEKKVKTYRIALGLNPVDDKRKEGDGCTPEGEFYVCTRNDRSKFHLFIGLEDRTDLARGVFADTGCTRRREETPLEHPPRRRDRHSRRGVRQ
jgi:hypothetical protein